MNKERSTLQEPPPHPPKWDKTVLAVLVLTVLIYVVGACHAFAQPDVFAPTPPVGSVPVAGLVVSNGVRVISHAWSGPTNSIDLTYQRWHFSASSDLSITGFINKTPAPTNAPFVLKIKSTVSGSSNITLRLPANLIDLNYGTSYTITNGAIISGEYDPNLVLTNVVGRVW